ncbi:MULTISPECIES: diflavin flavoprotein [unclassified Leptolyngbya]|uniref:diflavin flavoprotein n=1 Tax=unclassified Leptolyngbya TaxID=2650499 RepID=UPI0016847855|nr:MULTISPECIES: diflavin flavoprotein [unclassified Leptolyngbya]MBD1913893.1 flavin reductase [Leptolyngbya sp. FACHB-8]MBD2156345.1 flavin reductase [Leptolyngbya sp. FACHB-16]
MVALTERTQKRLTLQQAEIAPDTTTIRSQDWDRDRFDIEFELQNGTTYNSFLIRGEKVALIDTSHAKFQDLYLAELTDLIDPQEIDYLIVSHTEPDHSGLVKDVLALNPNITVVAAKVALQFLDELVHQPYNRLQVKQGDKLDLGNGHELEFLSAPNLHWPDTIFTYDHGTNTLFTCDAFGMHYCDESVYDEDLELIEPDYKLYYDCLMGPNARSVLSALKRMEALPTAPSTIATGHGPLLRFNLPELVGRYRTWSEDQVKTEKIVAVFYAAGYGYSDHLAEAIARGIRKTDVQVDLVDLFTADPQEIREAVVLSSGVVIGMPPQTGDRANQTHTALSTILASVHAKQAVGLFESGGGDDESVYPLRNQMQELGAVESFPPILIKQTPEDSIYQLCDEAGTDLGQWLTRDRTVKQMKALNSDLDKALGRISGGLYIITARKGETSSAMLASWVTQASLEPLGITIAVAKDRAIESFMHAGDHFVLNVLEEGNYQPLMKHFLKRFAPGADRFAGIKTYSASNGSPILGDALAYLECEVVSRMECSDHWIVYSIVDAGRVSNPDALTAVHHRKVGNHY